jgi:hypothetical protein
MRLVLILISAAWGVAAVLALAASKHRTRDARLTAAYILLWPVLAVALVLQASAPLWLSVPVVFGFVPWFLAGPHLWMILKDPSRTRPDEWIGIPKDYWLWGGGGSVLLGLLFAGYA